METLNSKQHDDRQTCKTPEKVSACDVDVINEIESLLHLYQTAIDGGIWSNHNGIFDHVQDIEYELAPESEFPVIPEPEEEPVSAAAEDLETQSANSIRSPQDAKQIFADTVAYIRQNKKLASLATGAACVMIILLIVLRRLLTKTYKKVVILQFKVMILIKIKQFLALMIVLMD